MKVNTTEYQGFKPFNLVITVESEAELVELWMRFNASIHHIVEANKLEEIGEAKQYIKKHYEASGFTDMTTDVWACLNDQIVDLINSGRRSPVTAKRPDFQP